MQQLIRILHRFEDGVLVLSLAAMIVFAVSQIIMRNVFSTGALWIDPLLRVLVLWVGLLGAMVATRMNNHISIDVLYRRLPQQFHRPVDALTRLFAAVVVAVIAWYGFGFVADEYSAGVNAFGSVPVWVCESIIPVAFAVMSLRFLYQAIMALNGKLKRAGP